MGGPDRPRLSATVITYNEADRIDACLASLAFCDEILVVDSGSTDATRELAEAAGARVLVRPFDGFRSQKQFAVEQARHDWILSLDADEVLDDRLAEAIQAERTRGFPDAAGYRFARSSEYFGRFLRHGNAYPDRKLRPSTAGVAAGAGIARSTRRRRSMARCRPCRAISCITRSAPSTTSWARLRSTRR